MPPKRRNIGRRTRTANQTATGRSNTNEEQREQRYETERQRLSRSRSAHTEEEREAHNNDDRLRIWRDREQQYRSDEVYAQQNLNDRVRRRAIPTVLFHAAFQYNPHTEYDTHSAVVIGAKTLLAQ